MTAALVLERLTGDGDLTAIDRSPKMVAQAFARNAAYRPEADGRERVSALTA